MYCPLTPLKTFDNGYLELLCSPRVALNTTRQQKLWCHIKILIWKELVKQGLENLEFLKNGFFLQFCFLPDPITFDDGPLGLILDFGTYVVYLLCQGAL